MSGALAIQTAIYSRLTGYTALTSLLASYNGNPSVFDEVPQAVDPSDSSAFPYVVIGHDTLTPWDTDTETGTDATVTIHSWSRTSDFVEVKNVMQEIYNALHRHSLSVSGYATVGLDMEFQDAIRDPDSVTRHGVQRFRLVME